MTAAGEIRKGIVNGNLGIRDHKPAPRLGEFLDQEFLPYARARHKAKPKTLDYYHYGCVQLKASKIKLVPLDEITEADVARYIDEHQGWTPSGINQGLRTLRRALRLAFEWRKIERRPTISLCANENMRDKVLTPAEDKAYLAAAKEPWKTMAIIMLEIGLRPGEVFALRCENLDWDAPLVKITSGKSKAAKRDLPMTDALYTALRAYWESTGSKATGWLFASPVKKGRPYNQKMVADWHAAALKKADLAEFDPYCLRHTALTRLAEHCKNPYALAAIAGHSSITMTFRYIHPQKAEIRKMFEEKSGLKIGHAMRRSILKTVGEADEVKL